MEDEDQAQKVKLCLKCGREYEPDGHWEYPQHKAKVWVEVKFCEDCRTDGGEDGEPSQDDELGDVVEE